MFAGFVFFFLMLACECILPSGSKFDLHVCLEIQCKLSKFVLHIRYE